MCIKHILQATAFMYIFPSTLNNSVKRALFFPFFNLELLQFRDIDVTRVLCGEWRSGVLS